MDQGTFARLSLGSALTSFSSQNTTRNFESLQKCIIDQYANYTIVDTSGKEHRVQSKMTNGEDMADAGGLAQSFRAWTDRLDSDKEGKKYDNYLLPGLGYSREQLFFIGECSRSGLKGRADRGLSP